MLARIAGTRLSLLSRHLAVPARTMAGQRSTQDLTPAKLFSVEGASDHAELMTLH
jgi:hypothetical protein